MQRAMKWLNSNLDQEIRDEVRRLMEEDQKELTDAFYSDLEFGTGGLRGIMGVGTNRMNKVTVAMATQGLANFLKKRYPDLPEIRMSIAHDSRNNSPYFARIAAEILSANGIKVYLFPELRPTPLLSFAVRKLKCQGGIVITASHNPKEYNGYKVYGEDGGQMVDPDDVNVIHEVRNIRGFDEVNFEKKSHLILDPGPEVEQDYLRRVSALCLSPEVIRSQKDLGIVYTSLHGTGVTLVPEALKMLGFENITLVSDQCLPDGNFPTLKSPNPEEASALEMAIEQANASHADLVLATDPDADRVGIAVRNEEGKFVLMNGNQTAAVLIWYLLSQWKEAGRLTDDTYIVKTIVTTELLAEMAVAHGVDCYDVLTGFKYIAEIIRTYEGRKTFIGGGEESYGYLVGDFVRDKDAVISCCMIAEIAAWAKERGKSFYQLYLDICVTYGLYHESLLSVTKKGKEGAEEIAAMMKEYREKPFKQIGGSRVITVKDFKTSVETSYESGITRPITLPQSDVLQFITLDGSVVTVRPSGTEPKIKFYFGVKSPLDKAESYPETLARLQKKILDIRQSMNL